MRNISVEDSVRLYKYETNMKGTNLGEFEELVLLVTASLGESAYTVAITDEINNKTNRSAVLSVVHTALHRLEKKGFVKSVLAGATEERGGRRKRMFTISSAGMKALSNTKTQRDQLWELIPEVNIQK